MGLALADAFDLGGVQRIDLRAALTLVLLAHPVRERRAAGRSAASSRVVAVDLAADVADDPTEPGAQELERPAGALELMGVGVAPMQDRRGLATRA